MDLIEYFISVWRAAKWRVAVCRPVCCLHHQARSDEYDMYRLRDSMKAFSQHWMKLHHLKRLRIARARSLDLRLLGPPNLILFGVGHSGTSVVTQMLMALGWHGAQADGDFDTEFFEHVPIRDLNSMVIRTGEFDTERARQILSALPSPWVIKDPRFLHTIQQWMPVLAAFQPTLLWLVRNSDSVRASYRRRQQRPQPEPVSRGYTVPQLTEQARQIFKAWPWKKLRMDFEDIVTAVSQFDVGRALRIGLAEGSVDLDKASMSGDGQSGSGSVSAPSPESAAGPKAL